MNVVLFHHARLPVQHYGGTERVVVWLARGLAELGHRVTVIAGRGTRVPEARVVEVDSRAAERSGFDLRPQVPAGTEVIHVHQKPGRYDHPSLWTLHGNASVGVDRLPPNAVCLSHDHARRHGSSVFVHNGLDPRDYQFTDRKGSFDLFLGRLHRVKGWRWAVEGARRTGRRLVVAGGWRPSLRPGIRFEGRVGGARKQRLLAEAATLWMPALWDEPFGLTLVEALMSGTPVLGTRRGSLPEIVTDRVGALGDTLEELVALRERLAAIDPHACRDHAVRHFSHRVMAERYLALYRRVIATNRLDEPIAPAASTR